MDTAGFREGQSKGVDPIWGAAVQRQSRLGSLAT